MISRRRRAEAGSEDGSRGIASMVDEIEPEPFEEMYSIFRIVTLYEMMIHGQWKYVVHYLDTKKTELVLGMYIGEAFELVRFICVLIIAIVFVLLRLSVLNPLLAVLTVIHGNMTWILTMNGLAIWIAFILAGIIVAQFAVYQCKNPNYVVICTTINFIFSIILITSIIPLAILKHNNNAFVKEGFHKTYFGDREKGMKLLASFQTRSSCCGVESPEDYYGTYIMTYTNALTNKTERIPVTREFSVSTENKFYSLPLSCCQKSLCSQRNLTEEETKEAKEFVLTRNWDMLRQFIHRPEPGSYYTRGCFGVYAESIESYTSVLISTLIIFAIFTALTIGFVIVLLLYHDGVGQMVSDQKMFGVERNTGVHFLMSLDMIDSDFQDDFSLIEFLRNSDIDKFMAGDRLKATISGRKEAERA